MIKKPWTPDNCPVQAGMCLHDTLNNVDILVTRRYLDWDDCRDEEKPLLQLGGTTTFTGQELMEHNFTYYPEWPCTLDERPCWNKVEEEEPDIIKLAQYVFNGLKESKLAVKGVHYTGDDKASVWDDDIHNKVTGIITKLADLFEEDKHDKQ